MGERIDLERAALDPEHAIVVLLHDGPPASVASPFEVSIVSRLNEAAF